MAFASLDRRRHFSRNPRRLSSSPRRSYLSHSPCRIGLQLTRGLSLCHNHHLMSAEHSHTNQQASGPARRAARTYGREDTTHPSLRFSQLRGGHTFAGAGIGFSIGQTPHTTACTHTLPGQLPGPGLTQSAFSSTSTYKPSYFTSAIPPNWRGPALFIYLSEFSSSIPESSSSHLGYRAPISPPSSPPPAGQETKLKRASELGQGSPASYPSRDDSPPTSNKWALTPPSHTPAAEALCT